MEKVGIGLAGAAVSKLFDKKRKKSLPRQISTGNSVYNTRTGSIEMDESVRDMQEDYISAMDGFRDTGNEAYDTFGTEMSGLRDELADLRGAYEGNQSAYREAMLNPLRENIAQESGRLNRDLGRTGVRGSFGNQARAALAIDSGRALSDQEAKIENDRINKLGDFLNIDADFIKTGLTTETARMDMLMALEENLRGISMDRFNQEMDMLGMPQGYQQSAITDAAGANASMGAQAQAVTGLLGGVIGGAGDFFGGTPSADQTTTTNLDDMGSF